ncbi:MAG: glycoside hydrolase family protein [Bacteroidales bacterium]|nr:glycoside hydrolase family protein [Bacteroidales bacterium]
MRLIFLSIISIIILSACGGPKSQQQNKIDSQLFLITSDEKLDEGAKLPYSHMSLNLEWTGAMIADKDYTVWGSSPIMGDDGKVHVFCARWPEFNVDPGWRRTCEVAHYVADQPEGPYTFVDVAVKGTGKDGDWDKFAPHNPEIKKIGDYYAIVFIANDDPSKGVHPANQKIGLVYSKSLYGPWKKAGNNGMIIEASNDPGHWTYKSGLGVDNPCLTEINGEIVVYFKAKTEEIDGHTGKARYSYAKAKTIEGPYIMSDATMTDNDSYLEDATCFTMNGKHYLITNDNHGEMSGIKGAAVLWESETGFNYSLNKASVAFRRMPAYFKAYDEAKVNKVYGSQAKFERPKVLMVNGRPAYLFAPSGWHPTSSSRVACNILRINY